ncbi:MAG TPA: SGNH/GDSL hydrolase family protein [Chitinophagales bacterium]|nr:SGNH/GDSL hydrolase family protein [Chitinophagales bacterium]
MRRIILLILFISFSLSKTFAQCTETTTPRVLLVGDSWAWFMLNESTINYEFKKWGHSNYSFVSNATLSVNGAQTDDVIKTACEDEIRNQLQQNPTIDYVHLSIGGNDFLGGWNVNFTPGQTDTLAAEVFGRLDSIVRFIQSCKPGIKILWSGYCYTNFKQVITDFIAPSSHPFYSTWSGMGFPDFIQINTLQNYFSEKIDSFCTTHPGVYYVHANSLMQYVYGQTTAMDVTPMGTYAAGTASIPLGFPDYPSPEQAMRDYALTKDCFHLSTDGYRYLIGYHTQKFYQKALMDDLYLLSDSNLHTGTVTSQGNTADSLTLGESSGEQFATVLSFNTTAMADTTLRKASLFIRRKRISGTNPLTASLEVKVKSGNFGTTADVEAADFNDSGDANGLPCQFGSNAADGDWIRLDLPREILMHINHNNPTQFVITAPGFTGGKVDFYNSSDPDFAPVLNLAYGDLPSAIQDVPAVQKFTIFPNPTNGTVNVANDVPNITHIEVCNIMGAMVASPKLQNGSFDISNLAAGTYILNVYTKTGKTSQLLVKE